MSRDFPARHAISRARFFLDLADRCAASERDAHEAFLEAAIIFGRTAVTRITTQCERHPDWRAWFDALRVNRSVEFFRRERNFILKEASPKVGQIIGYNPDEGARAAYYFTDPATPATLTVRAELDELARVVADAEARFGS